MRIAFFCPHSDPLAATGEPDAGGQCVYEAQVAAHLAALGHEVRAFVRRWHGKTAMEEIAPSAAVYRYPMGPSGFLRKEDMGPFIPEFVQGILAEQTDWLAGAELFHGHYWDGGAAALTASLALGKPLVFTSHSLGLLKRDRLPDPTADGSRFRYAARVRAEGKILQAADAVIALSQNERMALVGRYGADVSKIRIIPGGVDIASFAISQEKKALQRELGFSADHVAFTVGRLDPRKGFLELINALPVVATGLQAAGQTAVFLIPAGPPKPSPEEQAYRDTLHKRAAELGLMGMIQWFHRLTDEDMRKYYGAADLFLCPSPYEPFGLVIVEAFAAGTPVVATCHGGPAEIVSPGVNGYLADPADPAAFAARILDALLAPEDERRRMQAAALRTATANYSWQSVAAAIAAVYAAVCG